MHDIGYQGYIARKRSLVKKSNRYKRILWAREHLSKTKKFGDSILCPDENKFNIFGSDGCLTMWR